MSVFQSFAHHEVPNTGAVEAQATVLAATHGLGSELVAVDSGYSEALAAGAMVGPHLGRPSRNGICVARFDCSLGQH